MVQEKYRQTEKGKKAVKRYEQSKKGKTTIKKYLQSKEGKAGREKAMRKYRKSEKGKMNNAKTHAKRNRSLSFTPLMSNPFPKEVSIDYHHINDIFVVPVPRQVHQSMCGNNHRVKVNNWIEEIIGNVGVC